MSGDENSSSSSSGDVIAIADPAAVTTTADELTAHSLSSGNEHLDSAVSTARDAATPQTPPDVWAEAVAALETAAGSVKETVEATDTANTASATALTTMVDGQTELQQRGADEVAGK